MVPFQLIFVTNKDRHLQPILYRNLLIEGTMDITRRHFIKNMGIGLAVAVYFAG
jgi:hypothetical protein